VHTYKCLFLSPLVEMLPVGLQESTLPEKFISVLGQMQDALAVAASPRDLGWKREGISWFGFVWCFFLFFFF